MKPGWSFSLVEADKGRHSNHGMTSKKLTQIADPKNIELLESVERLECIVLRFYVTVCTGQAGQQDSHIIAIVDSISFKLLLFRIVRCKLNTGLLHMSA
jgi:hypothetical protein